MARVYSILAGTQVDRPERKVVPAAEPPVEKPDLTAELAAEKQRVKDLESRLEVEGAARQKAEQGLAREKETRAAAEGRLAEAHARIAELDARPMPEPQVIVRTVEVPTLVRDERPAQIVQMLGDVLAKLAPKQQKVTFRIQRDELGRMVRVVTEG